MMMKIRSGNTPQLILLPVQEKADASPFQQKLPSFDSILGQ
jgi:hypothetical protein